MARGELPCRVRDRPNEQYGFSIGATRLLGLSSRCPLGQ